MRGPTLSIYAVHVKPSVAKPHQDDPDYPTRVRDLSNGERAIPIPAKLRDKIGSFVNGETVLNIRPRWTEGGSVLLEITLVPKRGRKPNAH
jgi:hypothetical protein